ncbi:GntR family transcriptional regulator [Microbacterium foliorum]|uniref:GntR family transcriptional regulator n=1 Tax=Microbacterium foliorum TaxID=104336 RepID=UPI00209FC2DE|nr:GntR family transcriptional regulator [Microbacterium foliorum]MCP1428948.1 DNA-binding GntR family transcriptional regulator [Microbacterium foliorum]
MTRILRDDIILGRRAPGSRLVERDIAAELHVSRLPVREAIRTLVSEGVVVSRPRSWAVVREFTRRDIQDFGEVREAIETLIFLFAAERHTEEGLGRLRAALDRELSAAQAGDTEAARMAAGVFHEVATELAGNEMLDELIGVFVTRLRWLFGQHDDLLAMAEEHRVIFEAVAARDTDTLRWLIPQHLASGQATAERRLASQSSTL